ADEDPIDNYYAFRVLSRNVSSVTNCREREEGIICDTFFQDFPLYIESPDPLLVDVGNGLQAISDRSFSGGNVEIRLLFNDYQSNLTVLEMISLTEDGYRFLVSKQAYEESIDNPFAEPVNVHNNITNGYGIFMLSNRSEIVFRE
ncbi:MAG: DUF4249 family protein, partial [Bacteroidota bacterium]